MGGFPAFAASVAVHGRCADWLTTRLRVVFFRQAGRAALCCNPHPHTHIPSCNVLYHAGTTTQNAASVDFAASVDYIKEPPSLDQCLHCLCRRFTGVMG
jgi:hypothetical protein